MTNPTGSWAEMLRTGGPAIVIIVGGTSLQAMEGFITSAMLPSVVADIGGLELFAWNTTLFVVASILATLFAAVRPAHIGPRAAYIMAASALGLGSLLCGLAPSMFTLLAGRFVQGFGAGLIIAQSLGMLRIVFPVRLWPRVMALNSSVWGIATLLGPAVGGMFAEFGIWRWAFLAIAPAAAALAVGAWRVLPSGGENRPPQRLPLMQIFLVTAIVLDISVASLLTNAPDIAGSLVLLGLLGIAFLGLADTFSRARLLPEGTFSFASPMSSLFALILILGMTITCDIFAPLFLQRLHGLSPLWAGYMSALAAAGWSVSAIGSSGLSPERVRSAIVAAPGVMLAATLGLLVSLGFSGLDGTLALILAGVSLFALGFGIGLAFQHLSTRVLASARPGENDRTSAALGMVQLFASGIGAAAAGVVVNAAGLPRAVEAEGVSHAAFWLFASFAVIGTLGIPLAFIVARRGRPIIAAAE